MDETKDTQNQKEPESNWQYSSGDEASFTGGQVSQNPVTKKPKVKPVEWQASEYIAHDKSASWFLALFVGSVLLVGFVYLITKELLPSIVILVACVSMGVFAGRKPATKKFQIDSKGVHIEGIFHPYNEFRSFSIVEEGAFDSVWLVPLKRFATIVVMYFPPADEDKIVDVLANYLPNEPRELGTVDRFSKKIKF